MAGLVWTHRLHLYLPDQAHASDWALLTIGSDHTRQHHHQHQHQPPAPATSTSTTHIDTDLARRTGIPAAHLYDVPNQPLFDGLREDELLAHTLSQAHDTGDTTWPLLFPMVKAAVRALDTIGAVCGDEGGTAPARFVVQGASKRAGRPG